MPISFHTRFLPPGRALMAFLLTAAIWAAGWIPSRAEAQLDKVRLQLKWQHQFQFAGYYAAKEKGYYQEAGLDVEILPAKAGEDPIQAVAKGQAEFGVGTTDLLLLRAQGVPVVALAVIFQHSPLALMVHKKSGIQTIHDLVGSRLMIEPGSAELLAYLRREGLTTDKFSLLPHSFQVADFADGKVDGLSVYVTDESYEAVEKKVNHILFSPRTSGIDFYGDNLFTTQAQIDSHPERVEAFRAATLKGWDYAMSHPEEIIQLIHGRYSQRHSLEHLRFEAVQMQALLRNDLVDIGHMHPGRWQHIAGVYQEMGMLPADFRLEGFLYDTHKPGLDYRPWLTGLVALLVLLGLTSAVALYIHRFNRRLAVSEKRYRAVFDCAPVALIVSSPEGRITDWNQAAENIFGWSREEAIGRDLFTFLVPDSEHHRVHEVLEATTPDAMPTHSINRNGTKRGEQILCEWRNVSGMGANGGGGILSLGIDITERERLANEIRRAKEAAERTLEERQQFLAMISHEFTSPLAIIDSASQLLLVLNPAGETAPVVLRIRRAVKRVSSMLENFLAEDRLDSGGGLVHREKISGQDFFASIVANGQLLTDRHRILLEMDSGLESIHGDPQLLQIMLSNLLENAVKYSPAGGDIVLRARKEDGCSAVLEVMDHGVGIREEDQGRVFSKYFRSRQAGSVPGAGLGLYLVARVAALHGGTVGMRSEEGKGTVFTVRLPNGVMEEEVL